MIDRQALHGLPGGVEGQTVDSRSGVCSIDRDQGMTRRRVTRLSGRVDGRVGGGEGRERRRQIDRLHSRARDIEIDLAPRDVRLLNRPAKRPGVRVVQRVGHDKSGQQNAFLNAFDPQTERMTTQPNRPWARAKCMSHGEFLGANQRDECEKRAKRNITRASRCRRTSC